MLVHTDHSRRLAHFSHRVGAADAREAPLVSSMIADAMERLAETNNDRHAAQLAGLVEADAWTEVALAVLDVEFPHWKLCRLIYDGGEWHCTLSLHRDLPQWLDQAIETHHADLAMAIFKGLIEAAEQDETRAPAPVPRIRKDQTDPVLCENFF